MSVSESFLQDVSDPLPSPKRARCNSEVEHDRGTSAISREHKSELFQVHEQALLDYLRGYFAPLRDYLHTKGGIADAVDDKQLQTMVVSNTKDAATKALALRISNEFRESESAALWEKFYDWLKTLYEDLTAGRESWRMS